MMMRKKLGCCARDITEMSFDFDERIMTYNGLESCILNSHSFDNDSGTSGGNGCLTDSFDEDDSSCSSSTNNASGSFSSLWTIMKKNDSRDEWSFSETPKHLHAEEKQESVSTGQFSDFNTMKEKFAKLLLGEDVTGGAKGVSTALALSNGIMTLAASVFGELWKLEPLPEERKTKWQREMDWLLSPTKYMVELVPAKQNGANGVTLEIMTPKARADINMNLPALRKLDSMLIETLDSLVDTEFWYSEVGSRAEGRSKNAGESMRWWLPSPRVPTVGLSNIERKRLLHKGKLIYQVYKAAKAINENVLAEMPIPTSVKDALPKSGKASLGEELYRILSAGSLSAEEMINCLSLKSEHGALEAINRLEVAVLAWKEKITEQGNGKSPVRTSWPFIKDSISELDKMELLVNQAELLVQQLNSKYPNLPQTFLDMTKIQYGKDVGCSILEAYSRVLSSLAFSILSRIGDILQEDVMSNPNSPVAMSHLVGAKIPGISDSPMLDRVRHSLIDQLNNRAGGKLVCSSPETDTSDVEEAKISSVNATPSRSRVWCIGKEACHSLSAQNSP